MSDQRAMHDRRLSTHRAVGTRESTRCDAEAVRPNPAGFAHTTPNRRASLRHPQGVDGGDPLLDQNIATCEYRDELACTRLQPKASDADSRNRAAHVSDQGLKALFVPDSTRSIADSPNICTAGVAHANRCSGFSHSLGRDLPDADVS